MIRVSASDAEIGARARARAPAQQLAHGAAARARASRTARFAVARARRTRRFGRQFLPHRRLNYVPLALGGLAAMKSRKTPSIFPVFGTGPTSATPRDLQGRTPAIYPRRPTERPKGRHIGSTHDGSVALFGKFGPGTTYH